MRGPHAHVEGTVPCLYSINLYNITLTIVTIAF